MIAIASLLGFKQAGVHNLLPFLILGIGFDDIYVIVRGYDTGSKKHKSHRMIMQHTLANNGISITISSFTNVIGFGSGWFSSLDVIQSFGIFTAVGILML
jgi:predicted RND superfamily exporter protein